MREHLQVSSTGRKLREGAYAPKSKRHTFPLSFDFVHEGYWGKDDIERIVDIALDASDCDLVTIDFASVDPDEYPEYDDYVVTHCDVEFECRREGYNADVIKETLDDELSAIDYALAGIEFI